MSENSTTWNKTQFIGIFIVVIAAVVVSYFIYDNIAKPKSNVAKQEILVPKDTLAEEITEDFIKAVVPIIDSADNYILVSSPNDSNIAIDTEAGKSPRRIFSGRRINIAVTGVDSRLGTRTKHADANHIISLLIDSGRVEIYSIPRDTYADCGFDDSTNQNKLTILRAVKGQQAYLEALAEIARLDKIHYWVEFGFSQAMGIIELLGYGDAPSTLQVLRSRRGLGGDDFQRVYNQAQFMKQAIIKHFSRLDGTFGGIFVRGGLALVETNMNYQVASSLIEQMKQSGFLRNSADISIYVRPAMPIKFKVYDFSDKETLTELRQKIERFNHSRVESHNEQLSENVNVAARLNRAINKAVADSAKRPQASINTLKTYFEQRAWFQVKNLEEREKIRDEFAAILIHCYRKRNQLDNANRVYEIVESEKAVFNQNNSNNFQVKQKDSLQLEQQ